MGGISSSNSQKKKEQIEIKANNIIGKELRCDSCLKIFPLHTKSNIYNNHIKNCFQINKDRNRIEDLLNDLRISNYELQKLEKEKEKEKLKKINTISNNNINLDIDNENNFDNNYNEFDYINSNNNKNNNIIKTIKNSSSSIIKNKNKKSENFFDSSLSLPLSSYISSDIFFMPQEIFIEKNLNKNKIKTIKDLYNNPNNKNNILNINELSLDDIQLEDLRNFSFEEKLKFFKKFLKNLKIDWREGSCNLNIDREDFFRQSMIQFEKIDPYKELKINFLGEISHDAGGLIREWYSIIFKYLQSEEKSKKKIFF
jgi:hypothetical protein